MSGPNCSTTCLLSPGLLFCPRLPLRIRWKHSLPSGPRLGFMILLCGPQAGPTSSDRTSCTSVPQPSIADRGCEWPALYSLSTRTVTPEMCTPRYPLRARSARRGGFQTCPSYVGRPGSSQAPRGPASHGRSPWTRSSGSATSPNPEWVTLVTVHFSCSAISRTTPPPCGSSPPSLFFSFPALAGPLLGRGT